MELAERPLQFVKHQRAEKRASSSYVSEMYDKAAGDLSAVEEARIKWGAAALYTAGADTVCSSKFIRRVTCMLTDTVRKHYVDVLPSNDHIPGGPGQSQRRARPRGRASQAAYAGGSSELAIC
jgi:hypothetical protein